jgi:hypothetical protein
VICVALLRLVHEKAMSHDGCGGIDYEANEIQDSPRVSSTSCGARRNPDERQVHSFIVVPAKAATTNAVIKEIHSISHIVLKILNPRFVLFRTESCQGQSHSVTGHTVHLPNYQVILNPRLILIIYE